MEVDSVFSYIFTIILREFSICTVLSFFALNDLSSPSSNVDFSINYKLLSSLLVTLLQVIVCAATVQMPCILVKKTQQISEIIPCKQV